MNTVKKTGLGKLKNPDVGKQTSLMMAEQQIHGSQGMSKGKGKEGKRKEG